jgi:DNA-directed RNA polymerase specialized sigma24 family protein
VADRIAPRPGPDMPSAEQGAITQLERSAVISARCTLSARQREALVLRFYLDLSERQAASAMGISPGAVKYHTARAKEALRSVLWACTRPKARPRHASRRYSLIRPLTRACLTTRY